MSRVKDAAGLQSSCKNLQEFVPVEPLLAQNPSLLAYFLAARGAIHRSGAQNMTLTNMLEHALTCSNSEIP